ncbi:bifunctional 4-hydroxy-2-oxoglutarate aldolase/2-dehydro-3-deoxy-phosphogluconate aldolase [Streptomyces sp. NPDC048434]|uniref:bifunctional 4-hydroxy-2-oxoglutarate aldolase/2-dehydro-3-deoxy-phosphogluconate aldolase n=1 Tax=Streptomyces sp. NPDC048434 TaxID=3365549 RepID=UPI00371E6592
MGGVTRAASSPVPAAPEFSASFEQGRPSSSVLGLAPVIPVVVLDDAADAVPLARALVAGGLPAIEVTLRTPAALDAIRSVAAEVPEAVIGAGTLLTPGQVEAALTAGSRFLVSPGWSPRLLGAMKDSGVPFLPGVSTASEVVTLLDEGITEMKFFPAEAAGGTAYLRSLAAPLPQARFCPTGGIGLASAPSYLALPNVGCVGGTWMLPAEALAAKDWDRVRRLAQEAAALAV